ncbi:MAG TPA: LLM class F420-dependent oxidoreductase [Alphaproteobacteria bacterium]|jgi:probable F420-dependent oxidoreductase|nr:LLM class F420-dependent oxidoreductase [Alphaproteobacteria bacterium]HAM48529.1 LLM class F420-dependent oxidoreductase [Alphaproteobacteria bacterium]HBA41649.1 LLM class F420-dependent oxidoreductase [Alphaproteobacteria bacterium]HBC53359.1 LLM class F420-dependent oxidoreductase [Alphaproteobacteria bacterium]HBF97221.1 LLM class F420-dependent oxidoreductase [Alphaproteobacteria bacterium]
MRVGVIFPTSEIGTDPVGIRDYVQAAEELGFSHIIAFDHVLGAGLESRPDWRGPYSYTHPFHEPFVLFGYIAGITERIEMATGVLILPQRQTALVAKQTAQIDVLSGGRLRLGVGIGWNDVEYECLGEDFHTRGRRVEEQAELLRKLWADDLITFEGKWDRIPDAGINPRPLAGKIPLWFGGNADVALRRIARLADGWFPLFGPGDKGAARIARMRDYLEEAGRDLANFGIDPMIQGERRVPADWAKELDWWRGQGATHASLNTMAGGRKGPQAHIDAIREFAGLVLN